MLIAGGLVAIRVHLGCGSLSAYYSSITCSSSLSAQLVEMTARTRTHNPKVGGSQSTPRNQTDAEGLNPESVHFIAVGFPPFGL